MSHNPSASQPAFVCHMVIEYRDGSLDEYSVCGLPRDELGPEGLDGPLCEDCFVVINAMRYARRKS